VTASLPFQRKYKAGNDDVGHGYGEEELPAEAHELVVAEAGECGADPDEEEEDREDLEDEPASKFTFPRPKMLKFTTPSSNR